jgi:hypothetical protein
MTSTSSAMERKKSARSSMTLMLTSERKIMNHMIGDAPMERSRDLVSLTTSMPSRSRPRGERSKKMLGARSPFKRTFQ